VPENAVPSALPVRESGVPALLQDTSAKALKMRAERDGLSSTPHNWGE
jgi:hypothetical protein